jgi:hypothetical protein
MTLLKLSCANFLPEISCARVRVLVESTDNFPALYAKGVNLKIFKAM